MRHLNRHLFFVSLLFTALTVEAAQLGSAKGSAVFGRPLDLSVQVHLDAPAEDAANCFSADVFQADNKFDAGRVRLDVLPAANGLDATVRVRSTTAINEPWAKVILRSNCGAKVSRQYDFLTDFAADVSVNNMLAEAAPMQTPSPTAAAITTSPLATLGGNKSYKTSAKAKSLAQKTTTQVAIAPQQKAKPVASAVIATKKATDIVTDAVGQSRLKMETFELTDEHQVLLKLSTALIAPAGMRTPEEIQALAQATAVWRAINGMPAEVQTPAVPVVAAAVQVKATAVETPPVTLPALVNQKLASKSEFSNLMVYGLIGLLVMTLGCITWLWLRVRKAARAGYGWLNDVDAEENDLTHEPTQFLHSNFHETETVAQEELEPVLDTETEIKAEAETEPEIFIDITEDQNAVDISVPPSLQSETALSSSPLAALMTDSEYTKLLHKSARKKNWHVESVVTTAIADKPIVNPLPPHFDDPRFDERVLRSKKKSRETEHEQPIVSSTELMDLVLADTPPKLRSVTTPAPELVDKPGVTSVKTKDDSKSNLIDFDVFAEPEPLNRPTRFVR